MGINANINFLTTDFHCYSTLIMSNTSMQGTALR